MRKVLRSGLGHVQGNHFGALRAGRNRSFSV
jgi:hypothetical protein